MMSSMQRYLPDQTNTLYHLHTRAHNMTMINKTTFLNDTAKFFVTSSILDGCVWEIVLNEYVMFRGIATGGISVYKKQSTLQIFMWLLVVFFLFDPRQIRYRASVRLSSCFFYLLTHHNLYPPQMKFLATPLVMLCYAHGPVAWLSRRSSVSTVSHSTYRSNVWGKIAPLQNKDSAIYDNSQIFI